VLCHPCRLASELNIKLFAHNAEPAFSVRGYLNWKDATWDCRFHELCGAHQESVMKMLHLLKGVSVLAKLNREAQAAI
jgi:hypothetical protein